MSSRKHSFPPVVDARVRVLILGSLPGDRSLAEQRYYAHPQNQFWRLLSPVVGTDLAALSYSKRLEALLQAHIGLWDAVQSASRPGSTDAALRDVETQDIAALAESLPELKAIAFNGATAYKLGMRQLGALPKNYRVLQLPSSSPLHTIGLDAKLPAWRSLSALLTNPI